MHNIPKMLLTKLLIDRRQRPDIKHTTTSIFAHRSKGMKVVLQVDYLV